MDRLIDGTLVLACIARVVHPSSITGIIFYAFIFFVIGNLIWRLHRTTTTGENA